MKIIACCNIRDIASTIFYNFYCTSKPDGVINGQISPALRIPTPIFSGLISLLVLAIRVVTDGGRKKQFLQ